MAGFLLAGLTGVFILFAQEDAPPEHKQWMKDLGACVGQIRKGVEIETNAAKIANIGAQVDKWWSNRTSEIAGKASKEIVAGANAVVAAAKAEDKQGIAAGLKGVNAGCRNCHEVHRLKISDTEYKIK
jgi:hypothetical protein